MIIHFRHVNFSVRGEDNAGGLTRFNVAKHVRHHDCSVPPTREDALAGAALDPIIGTDSVEISNDTVGQHNFNTMIARIGDDQCAVACFGNACWLIEPGRWT